MDLKPGGNRARAFPKQWNGSVPDVTTLWGMWNHRTPKWTQQLVSLLFFLVQRKPEIKCVCLAEILLVSRAKTYRKCTCNSLLLHASGLELPMHPANSVTGFDTRVETINAWEKHNPVPKLTYLFLDQPESAVMSTQLSTSLSLVSLLSTAVVTLEETITRKRSISPLIRGHLDIVEYKRVFPILIVWGGLVYHAM